MALGLISILTIHMGVLVCTQTGFAHAAANKVVERAQKYGVNLENCGMRPFSSRSKIVGGEQAKAGDWGWQVSE